MMTEFSMTPRRKKTPSEWRAAIFTALNEASWHGFRTDRTTWRAEAPRAIMRLVDSYGEAMRTQGMLHEQERSHDYDEMVAREQLRELRGKDG